MRITREVLEAMGCTRLTVEELAEAEKELAQLYEGRYQVWHYCPDDEVWKLHLHGFVFHLHRHAGDDSDTWSFGVAGSSLHHSVSDIEEMVVDAFEDGFEAGYEQRAEETRAFLFEKKKPIDL